MAGHRIQDILGDYTLDEVFAYHGAALRGLRRSMGAKANIARAAQHATNASYRRFLKALTDAGKEAAPARMSGAQFFRFFDSKIKGAG